jgi:hypothetical protein
MIIFSTILLLFYIVFASIQSILFSSNSFDSPIPWCTLERRYGLLKMLLKTILAVGFVFDKKGTFKAEVNLVCFVVSASMIYQRFRKCIMY